MKYITSKRMREIDLLAQEKYSIPSLVLMENAGIAASDEIIKYFESQGKLLNRAAIFCGKGNNGGDGFVIARQLSAKGIAADIFITGSLDDIKPGDPRVNLEPLRKMGMNIVELRDIKDVRKMRRKLSCDAIIDAIFGTGFSGILPVHIAHIINFINEYDAPVFAIDIPSGLDATTGEVRDACVKADVTVTFGLPKTGFVRSKGSSYCGKVIVRNISYPRGLLK